MKSAPTAPHHPEARLELVVEGMDCAGCAAHVREAVTALPGVYGAEAFLATGSLVVRYDPARVDAVAIRQAVAATGYRPAGDGAPAARTARRPQGAERATAALAAAVFPLLAAVFALVFLLAVAGEVLGGLERANGLLPPAAWLALVLVGGYPVFRGVLRAALRRRVTAHTLMTLGLLAALAVSEWATALLVVLFMRIGQYVERMTAERARQAIRQLAALAPQRARVERDGAEVLVPVEQVRAGDVVIVRPGERIPVDGEVVGGQATVDHSAVTGESMPVEAGPGTPVFAAGLVQLGMLRVRALRVGEDTTFGRAVRLVEEAEAHRGEMQRLADRFSAYYLPVALAVAAGAYLFKRDPLAAAAVLLVACSCSFALATPVAVLASVGAAARRGLLVKGGRYLEALARADVVLLDKTGTLTLGRPRITDVVPLDGRGADELLALAAAAERHSEHPLAEAVRAEAAARGLAVPEPERFEAVPGLGVRARVEGREVAVGSPRLLGDGAAWPAAAASLQEEGKTVLLVALDGRLAGILAAADAVRPEVPAALAELRRLGVRHMELLTGDHERAAAALARQLGIPYRAGLLPEDKLAVVREYQRRGHVVVMVGDGVNDAPALAQADVGIAMGAAGTPVALEAAHAALMREDWRLVPELFRIARRTVRTIRLNLAFTALYNLAGLSLAAAGLLPPALAAAAQALPDLFILGNSSRLFRHS